jgi:sortase A
LQPGDFVTVSTIDHSYTYVVQGRQIVGPTDVWVMASQGDARQLTLISCYPYQVDTKRIVVFATLQIAPNS